MNKFLVYILKCPVSNLPFYVGKGKTKRLKVYFQQCQIKTPVFLKCKSLHQKGLEPIVEIFKKDLTEQDAFELEKELIKKYGRRDLKTGILLNLTDGGEGTSGYKVTNHPFLGKHHTDETKRKISNNLMGYKHTQETKKILSQQRIGNIFAQGKKHSKEANFLKSLREKGNQKAKGFKHTEEAKRKISESSKLKKNNLGKKFPDRKKGYKLKEETKHKMSIARNEYLKTNQGIIIECPFCGKKGSGNAMKQWHFKNCKLKGV